jgi:nitric oxide reductase subunit C
VTKRQTRLFFIVGTLVFALIFIAMTVDSHRQFGTLTNAHLITEDVTEGKHIWHQKNCINCHTLLGEGAYFAPDLTKITQHRGEAYLTAFLQDPSLFYSDEQHRRLMPNPELDDQQIAQVIAFLDWVSRIDNQGWPPRPILVTGSAIPGAALGRSATGSASNEPVSLGQEVFHRPTPGCFACHSTAPGVDMVGPSVAGVGARAEAMIADPGYMGSATDAESYIRESILDPNAFLVPGATFSAEGISFMPQNAEELLSAEEIEQLVAYLMTLR